MSTQLLTKNERGASQAPPTAATSSPMEALERDELRVAEGRQRRRVRRLKINAVAWALGSVATTTLWVVNQWEANGAFQHFGSHSGNRGDWNPTLEVLLVVAWGLIVGIMALRVRLERPRTREEVDREVERLEPHDEATGPGSAAALRRRARGRLDEIARLRFHVAAWALGMVVLTPLWALLEWQDNGGFVRWSGDGRPGSWEPWILYVGGIWALVVALLALRAYLERPGATVAHEALLPAFFAALASASTGVSSHHHRARWTSLTRRDLTGPLVAALVVLVYAANAQAWWYLESNRWAAVTMVAVSAVGCPLGARLVGERPSAPIVLLGLLGAAALLLAVLAIVTAAQWALLALAVVLVALCAGTTLRHALTPRPAAVR